MEIAFQLFGDFHFMENTEKIYDKTLIKGSVTMEWPCV